MTASKKVRVTRTPPQEITAHQLECATYWLELIGDEEAILELFAMRLDYEAYKLYLTGEVK